MGIMLRMRTLPAGFIAPCLPTKTAKLPSGSQWLHEIKHDGFRIIARKTGAQVRLYSRPGNDLTRRFPLIVETLARLRAETAISVILLGRSKQILASEKVSDLLPHIHGGGADIEGGIQWGLLRLRLHRWQMSLQIYTWRFGEVCSEPHKRLLIVIEGSHVGYGCSRRGWRIR
jgi:cytochrome c1